MYGTTVKWSPWLAAGVRVSVCGSVVSEPNQPSRAPGFQPWGRLRLSLRAGLTLPQGGFDSPQGGRELSPPQRGRGWIFKFPLFADNCRFHRDCWKTSGWHGEESLLAARRVDGRVSGKGGTKVASWQTPGGNVVLRLMGKDVTNIVMNETEEFSVELW